MDSRGIRRRRPQPPWSEFPAIRRCHNEDTQHNSDILTNTEEFLFDVTGTVVCIQAGGAAPMVAKLAAQGALWLKRPLTSSAAERGIRIRRRHRLL